MRVAAPSEYGLSPPLTGPRAKISLSAPAEHLVRVTAELGDSAAPALAPSTSEIERHERLRAEEAREAELRARAEAEALSAEHRASRS
ncbi:MAG: hypothetical protein R3B70_15250 [Polyangiaceae bacterium]